MNHTIITKTYKDIPFCTKEILRYAGCALQSDDIKRLLDECLTDAKKVIKYKLCYTELDLNLTDCNCDFGCFEITSKSLSANLKDCKKVILFAATIGMDFDRLIHKYSAISPAKAHMLSCIGNAQVEALCDEFCKEISKTYTAKPRFSAGYGDLALDVQKDIFEILNPTKNIGIFLNDSLLMTPSKSVTAFIGVL